MNLYPSSILETIEFDKIIHLLQAECNGDLAQIYFNQLQFETDICVIENKLDEVAEMKLSLLSVDPFPVSNYFDCLADLKLLDIEGYVLSIDSLQRINIILRIASKIYKYLNISRQDVYPNLYKIVRSTPFDEFLQREITRVIDENGEIKSDASPELTLIRRQIQSFQRDLDRVFKNCINDFRSKGFLTENVESIKNGRRVLSVPAEHKRKIKGIIHDESASGKTTFIEPEAVIEINNEIIELEQEEKREIYRILKELSAKLRPYSPIIRQYQSIIVRMDVIYAKARLAIKLKANKPILKEKPCFSIIKAYHPLLYLKNNPLDKKTIPFNFQLFGKNRIVVISGPNAGGKSITLKAVGLLQMMLQSGNLVPMDSLSEIGIFENIFGDIGDQQSLEDELSTYSSRLKNAKTFVELANEKSLVLIDEFGSGTDPKMGGAIAEGILKELNQKGVFGVITTHFGNLKMFAFKSESILNGCMNFDTASLSPTYELIIGRPGSSFAFEIANKNGLPASIINYAKKRVGKNENAVDELLIDLLRERNDLQDQLQELDEKQKKLQKLIHSYEEMHKELEYKRKKHKLDIKETEIQKADDHVRMLEKLVKELRNQKNMEKAQEAAEKAKLEKEKAKIAAEKITDDIVKYHGKFSSKKLEEGDFVRLRAGGAHGKITKIDKDGEKAMVIIGDMTMTIRLIDLVSINEPLEKQELRVKRDIFDDGSKFDAKIDLRGLRLPDALKALEVFIDKAFINSSNSIQILHGKGDGILRKAVKQKVKEYKGIKSISHPAAEFGGDGITNVELL